MPLSQVQPRPNATFTLVDVRTVSARAKRANLQAEIASIGVESSQAPHRNAKMADLKRRLLALS